MTIASLNDLLNIITSENGESLVVLDNPLIEAGYENDDMLPYTGEKILVRQNVYIRLLDAAHFVRQSESDTSLRVVYGYRAPEVQLKYHNQVLRKLETEEPDIEHESLLQRAHLLAADPRVAGHPTGGAVDVTLMRDGKYLPMGSGIAKWDEYQLFPTFVDRISDEAKRNRLWLREVMERSGFAPFDGEWWHFSYGDREWAFLSKFPHAIYDTISLRQR